MRTALVSFQLDDPRSDHSSLRTALEATGTYWCFLDRTWVVGTEESPEQLRDRLVAHLDRADRLLVVDITGQDAAWTGFPKDAHDWLVQEL